MWLRLVGYANHELVLCECRYVVIYFSILAVRYHAGIVTDEMIAVPKSRFVVIGVLEALGVATGMSAAGTISGCLYALRHKVCLISINILVSETSAMKNFVGKNLFVNCWIIWFSCVCIDWYLLASAFVFCLIFFIFYFLIETMIVSII